MCELTELSVEYIQHKQFVIVYCHALHSVQFSKWNHQYQGQGMCKNKTFVERTLTKKTKPKIFSHLIIYFM